MWPLGPTKLSLGVGAECSHRDPLAVTAHTLTSPLITNDKLNCWSDFFNSILLIMQWVKLAEPYKVRLDINLGVPGKVMLMKPLLGPGC